MTALFLCIGTMSAQTGRMAKGAIMNAEQMNALTEATDIVVQNISPTNRWYFCGDKNVEDFSANSEALFVWEPAGDGNFYLKKKYPTEAQGDGYLQTSSPTDMGSKEGAQKFTAAYAYPTDAPDASADSENLVRFVRADNTGTWINCQATNGTPKYNSGAGAWTMHNVYQLIEGIEVTYIYKVDGKEYETVKVMQAKNSEANAPAKDFLAIEEYVGTIGDSDCEIVVNCSAELPFVAADDVESISTWYYVQMHSNNKKYIQYLADQNIIEWADAQLDEAAKDSCTWAFVGNIFDGFKVVNKAATTEKALLSTGSGDATMAAYAEATQFVLAATAETSEAAQGGFCLRHPEQNQYLNAQNGKVAHWSSADAGSTILVTVVENEPEITIAMDVTDKVGTSKEAWNATSGPVTIDGISMPEKYETTTETLGDVMWQTVTGLENGKYTVELWANARYTSGRGFESQAADGALDFTYLYANNVEVSIEVYHNGDLNNGKSYVLEGVEVTDGTLKMGMTKKAAGSNWHTIQIKSLIYHAPAGEAYEAAKADLKAALDAAAAVSPVTEALAAAIAAAQAIYDASTDIEEIKVAVASLQTATALAVNTNAVAGATVATPVATNFVVNGTFDTWGVVAPWKTTIGAQNQTTANNQQGAFTGNFFENWHPSNYSGKIYQVIENLPNGGYELSICAFVSAFDASAQYVYANGDKVALTGGAPTAYKVLTIVTDNKIEIGFEQTVAVNQWSGIDNVSLTYYGADASIAEMKASSVYIEYNNVVGKPMDAAVSAAMETAKGAYESDASDENLAAFTAAVQAATASVNAYASNKLAIDAMFALMESTNVYTAEAYATYAALAEGYLAQYEAGTLTGTVDNPATIHGWHADVAYDDLLLSAFGTNNFDTDLYINTWSTEGENDGSEFKVPFFEYWTGDANSLAATTKTATVTGLVAGKTYSLEAWVRVRAKNDVAAADATGITLSVGEGKAVDVTEGVVVGESQFAHAVYTAVGKADAEGNLTINFTVDADNNISWLSFKNLKYAEVAEPEYLPIVGAMVGEVAIVDGAATVSSISTIDIIFDCPVALAENAGWATLADSWGPTNLNAEVLADNNCIVRFTVSADFNGEFTEAGDYLLNIPEGFIVGVEDANYINAEITATITIEGAPATPLTVVNVTVGENVISDLSAIVATPTDMIKVNFDGPFYFQGEPTIVDAEGNNASEYFQFMNGLDLDGSNSYIFMAQSWEGTAAPAGVYTITLAKASFLEMMQWKAPAEDIVLTVQITVLDGIENIEATDNTVIYTITGKRVEGNVKSLEKGIYIVNGKKVLVK